MYKSLLQNIEVDRPLIKSNIFLSVVNLTTLLVIRKVLLLMTRWLISDELEAIQSEASSDGVSVLAVAN